MANELDKLQRFMEAQEEHEQAIKAAAWAEGYRAGAFGGPYDNPYQKQEEGTR